MFRRSTIVQVLKLVLLASVLAGIVVYFMNTSTARKRTGQEEEEEEATYNNIIGTYILFYLSNYIVP